MKRLLLAVAVAALVAIPAASARQAAAPTLKPGHLTVGLNPPAVGFQVGTLRGNSVINPHGFEIDLAKDIAAKLGISAANITWINIPFDTLFRPGAKPFDFAFEESTITPARAKAVDFTSSYFNANQGVLMKVGGKSPTSLAQLKALKLCAQSTTTGLDYLQHKLHATHIQIYNTTAAAFAAVQAGRCDAFVMDVPIIASQKKTKPSAYGPIAGQIETHEQYGGVLSKGSKLTASVSAAINALNSDGTIGKLQTKWFAIDVSKIPVLK
ncbi:MAG TPA: ABC transporter substrate-binding protein [Gaiellaceae bacterium]|nr:ABC transporter substrate-binding protein [Gaiellaceae bacterium]